ncbi:hypothetical protein ES288_A04G099200v1 [Gossypium darwinii]|uniref:Glycosyltransferase n=1 Tax=Gossypium darwinii TaxID=34276 RepID=A0A5D2GWV6_GOSDA|nr:hypothetical protein ES288_A04G099200v1 [Gossypium darwinii]
MAEQLHFVLIPLMAQGHMIPMIDLAKLLAEQRVMVSLITTPHNASRFDSVIQRATQSGLQIQVVKIPFPCREVGLPVGCENLDTLSSRDLLKRFYNALGIVFLDGMGCFSLLCSHNVKLHKAHLSVASDTEPFVVPGLPQTVEITRAQLPGAFVSLPDLDDVRNKMQEAEMSAFGVVINSFNELEQGCVEQYQKAIKKKVWTIGPVSLCNKMNLDKFERGNKASIKEQKCMKWLDSKEPRSVIYACLGSLCRLVPAQLIELGLGLEASQQPFIWVVKTSDERAEELEKWFSEQKYEERIKGRGLLIKGWAPQVLILSHPAIGGFITHSGWNSTIESVCSGVPMITWPQFSEQFFNEKLIVQILKIGVGVGVEVSVRWGEEEKLGVLVKKHQVEKAIDMLMDGGEEGENRRVRARELAEIARKSLENGGSSYCNMSLLVRDILEEITKSQ